MYKPNTLYIDSWSSRCGSCAKECDYRELQHDSLMGYAASTIADETGIPYPLEGCHAEFIYVDYIGPGPLNNWQEYATEVCNRLRPDLKQL